MEQNWEQDPCLPVQSHWTILCDILSVRLHPYRSSSILTNQNDQIDEMIDQIILIGEDWTGPKEKILFPVQSHFKISYQSVELDR